MHGTRRPSTRAALVETHGYPGERYFIENPGWLSGGALAWFVAHLRLTGVEELERAGRPGAAGRRWRHLPARALRRHGAGMDRRGPRLLLRPDRRPTARRICARAVLEGCAFAMRDVVDRLTALGVDTGRIRSAGRRRPQPRLGRRSAPGCIGRPVEVAAVVRHLADRAPPCWPRWPPAPQPSLDSGRRQAGAGRPWTIEPDPAATRRLRRGLSALPAPVRRPEADVPGAIARA